jgi:hypothetical protein
MYQSKFGDFKLLALWLATKIDGTGDRREDPVSM